MLRDIQPKDLLVIDEIHQRCHKFPVPKLNHIVDDKVICLDDGKVVGYGLLKLFPELIMVLDTNVSVHKRLTALNEFLENAIAGATANGASQLHAFVEDARLSEFLIERYRFQPVEAKPLVLNLE